MKAITPRNQEEELLLSAVLNKPREYLIAHPELKLTYAQAKKFSLMKRKLASGWPLAYILEYKWFYGYKFYVDPNVLIPRPETEMIVEKAINDIKSFAADKSKKIIIADIGTGSGAIIISFAKEIISLKLEKKTNFYATDISAKALAIAQKNAKNILGRSTKINFMRGNLAQPLLKEILIPKIGKESSLIITANLPYLTKKELNEKSIRKEPKLALYGGSAKNKKGFDKIESLIKQLAQANLKSAKIFLEINYNQEKIAKKVIKEKFPKSKVKTLKDLSGFYRIVEVELTAEISAKPL